MQLPWAFMPRSFRDCLSNNVSQRQRLIRSAAVQTSPYRQPAWPQVYIEGRARDLSMFNHAKLLIVDVCSFVVEAGSVAASKRVSSRTTDTPCETWVLKRALDLLSSLWQELR